MTAPSFLFSGIDKETLSLSDELNSMGGGDAQASHLEIHAVVNSNLSKNDTQLLWPYDNMIGLRNVSLPVGSPVTKNMKYVQVDSVTVHNGTPAVNQEFADIASDASHWVAEGFNSCIFSLGMRVTGKTTAMFGNFGLQLDAHGVGNSLAATVLSSLFENKKSSFKRRESTITIAISAWSVVQDKIIDLIAPSTEGREPLDFASVECPDLATAHQILHECRARAPGCLPNNHQVHEAHRGHFFLRILLHTQSFGSTAHSDTGNVSYIYLVDLLGLASMDNTRFNRLPEEERIFTRANNLQLQCLIKVLGEMRALSTAAATNPFSPAETALTTMHASSRGTTQHNPAHQSIMKMTSARDSKLTTILAPIIQGNVKNTLLLFLQDGASVANETQNLLNAVNGVTGIVSACLRIKDISLRSLGLLQHNDVLGPYFDPTRHSHEQPRTQTQALPPQYLSPMDLNNVDVPRGRSLPLPQSPQSAFPNSSNNKKYIFSDDNHHNTTNFNAMYSPESQSFPHPYHPVTTTTVASPRAATYPAYPTNSSTVITDTSTDYGEIDFDRILAGDFHLGSAPNSPQHKNKSGNLGSNSSGRKRSPSGAAKVQSLGRGSSQQGHVREAENGHVEDSSGVDFVNPRSEAHSGNVHSTHHGEHRLHYREEDLARVEHPPSQDFLQHRRAHYQNEAHPSSQPQPGRANESAVHYGETDVSRGDHPPSPPFLAHRRAFNHDEVDPSHHVVHPAHPHYQSTQDPSGHAGHAGPVFGEDESPERGPRTHPEVLQVLHDYHDLMEELHNDHRAGSGHRHSRDRDRGEGKEGNEGSRDCDQPLDASMGIPSQVVNDFLQHHHLQGAESPTRNNHTANEGEWRGKQASTPPSASSQQRRQQDKASPKKGNKHNTRTDSTIGSSEVQYGAEDSFFSHVQFPIKDSPHRKQAQRGGNKSSALESSMMADSLFNGSEVDASVDDDAVRTGSPTNDDHFKEQDSAPRGYRYQFGSARTSVETAHTNTFTSESTSYLSGDATSRGIGSGTAAPVLLRGPRLADTSPADLDTVNFITSSYADFFQDALQAGDPRHGHHQGGSCEDDYYSDGGEGFGSSEDSQNNSDFDVSNGDDEEEERQNLDNTIDSLELDAPSHSSEPSRYTSHSRTSHHSQSSATAATTTSASATRAAENRQPDSYVPYVDSAIPDGSITLAEAMRELEHLRRTNHSLVESLSDEKQRRSELESKLNGAQDDLLEVRTQCDVQIDTYKLETMKLKTQLRALCDNQSLTDVFATFEDNVARLVRENEALRQANLALEAKELDSLLRTGANSGSSDVHAFANTQSNDGTSESYRLQTAKKENLRLVTKLKKCGIEREALKAAFEEVKTKERHFVVNTKIANDCARRLRITHQDLIRVKKELEQEQAARAVAERDLHCIRRDTAGLRESEATLKEERSRHLAELAMLRERVREVDNERKRLSQLHRFVEKHYEPTYPVPHHRQPSQSPPRRTAGTAHPMNSFAPPPPPPHPAVASILKAALPSTQQPYRARIAAALSQHNQTPLSYAAVPPYGMPTAVPRAAPASAPVSAALRRSDEFVRDSASTSFHSREHSSQGRHSSDEQKGSFDDADPIYSSIQAALSEGTIGQAGLSDAQYLRLEESDGIDPALEVSLTAMHESLIATTPQLLPLFRRLTGDIHTERTRALQKRSQLLNQLGSAQYTTRGGAAKKDDDDRSRSRSPVRSNKDTNAAYLNMLNSRGLGNQSSYATQHDGKAKKSAKSVRF